MPSTSGRTTRTSLIRVSSGAAPLSSSHCLRTTTAKSMPLRPHSKFVPSGSERPDGAASTGFSGAVGGARISSAGNGPRGASVRWTAALPRPRWSARATATRADPAPGARSRASVSDPTGTRGCPSEPGTTASAGGSASRPACALPSFTGAPSRRVDGESRARTSTRPERAHLGIDSGSTSGAAGPCRSPRRRVSHRDACVDRGTPRGGDAPHLGALSPVGTAVESIGAWPVPPSPSLSPACA